MSLSSHQHDPPPVLIETEEQLDDLLSRPSFALIDFVRNLQSPLVILGAGGKMGPTLALLARRAADAAQHPLEIVAVSRFSNAPSRQWLESRHIKTVSCDLLNPRSLESLPDSTNVIYLVGLKFGTKQNPSATWAINTLVPTYVAQRYSRARIVALSTGNVYPLDAVNRGGSLETDPLTPLGEYANAAVARERIFEYHSCLDNVPIALLRLFYAVELRYGVLVDIAQKVHAEEPIDLANGSFNCIWQGDANEMVLRSFTLATTPLSPWNLCLPEVFSVRAIASRLGELFEKQPRFTGAESPTALLGDSSRLCKKLGAPATSIDIMLPWIAHWIKGGGRSLGRPTHFEVRDGNY